MPSGEYLAKSSANLFVGCLLFQLLLLLLTKILPKEWGRVKDLRLSSAYSWCHICHL